MAGRTRYDNPFEEGGGGDEVNPFAQSRPTPPSTRLSPLPPEPADFYNDFATPVDIPMDTNKDMKTREKELLAKEAELSRREKEIKRREEAAARAGIVIEEKNWPPFFPIIHHDINNEIPVHLQRTQYVAFASLLGLILCLFWNIVCVTAAWIKGEGPKIWFLAVIYFILGCPGAYYLWYRPLYRAMRNESALKFGWFFLFYMRDFSSDQLDRQECYCRGVLLSWVCNLLRRVIAKHVGHSACVSLLPRKRERSTDEARGSTQRGEGSVLIRYWRDWVSEHTLSVCLFSMPSSAPSLPFSLSPSLACGEWSGRAMPFYGIIKVACTKPSCSFPSKSQP